MRLGIQALLQCRNKPGLAEPGLARHQHDLAFAGIGAHPSAQQQLDFLVAADQPS